MKPEIQDVQKWGNVLYEAKGQMNNYLNLLDMANAIRYGFSQYRLPKPGVAIDTEEARERMTKLEEGWSHEKTTRDLPNHYEPSPKFTRTSLDTQCYLHSILESNQDADYDEIEYMGMGV